MQFDVYVGWPQAPKHACTVPRSPGRELVTLEEDTVEALLLKVVQGAHSKRTPAYYDNISR